MLIKLHFQGISNIVDNYEIALLLLTNDDNSRLITIVSDTATANSIMSRKDDSGSALKSLPDVLWKALSRVGEHQWQIRIVSVVDGNYNFVLYDTTLQQSYYLKASDGVLLSLISGLPIFIDEITMLRQSVPYNTGSSRMALPLNAISDAMLENALKQAVENENYEQASYLRDELNRRKKSKQ